ncbi:MAG: hypothetical protein HY536_02160 [Candidatus Colwellbacteria bacterium]|nr:hypothetical protein [Candidatus Colwellbacteria bacterium]
MAAHGEKWNFSALLPFAVLAVFAFAIFFELYLYFFTSPCVVVPRKWCSRGVPVYHENELVGIGFALPAGTRVSAPFRGVWSYTGRAVINGVAYPAGGVEGSGSGSGKDLASFIGDLALVAQSNVTVRERELIARIPDAGEKHDGAHNLVVSFATFDPTQGYFIENRELLKTFFADIQ